jgi:hypothetical protein
MHEAHYGPNYDNSNPLRSSRIVPSLSTHRAREPTLRSRRVPPRPAAATQHDVVGVGRGSPSAFTTPATRRRIHPAHRGTTPFRATNAPSTTQRYVRVGSHGRSGAPATLGVFLHRLAPGCNPCCVVYRTVQNCVTRDAHGGRGAHTRDPANRGVVLQAQRRAAAGCGRRPANAPPHVARRACARRRRGWRFEGRGGRHHNATNDRGPNHQRRRGAAGANTTRGSS